MRFPWILPKEREKVKLLLFSIWLFLNAYLDNCLERRDFIFDEQNFLQLFPILNHDDVALTVKGTVKASLRRVGGINTRSKTSIDIFNY